ncbi:hypothetical protein [Aurantimonas sp. VKM B-3413]|uniref:hypothetical protein n=1 Tax=Aurantimonas sp. VKM B-3413 TaxID=2779401 RepID=UPI001E3D2BE2|nr:hypothetical protein [Aurantimonas sp. VKM B-3413]MCB8840054.1 hypothetical protein [Aurantimonas sp. VKM B-3413]
MSKMRTMSAVAAVALLGIPVGAMADALIPGSGATFYSVPDAARSESVLTRPTDSTRTQPSRIYRMPQVTAREAAATYQTPAAADEGARSGVLVPGSEADF